MFPGLNHSLSSSNSVNSSHSDLTTSPKKLSKTPRTSSLSGKTLISFKLIINSSFREKTRSTRSSINDVKSTKESSFVLKIYSISLDKRQ